jgi:S-adenosylmethionine decarboxylase
MEDLYYELGGSSVTQGKTVIADASFLKELDISTPISNSQLADLESITTEPKSKNEAKATHLGLSTESPTYDSDIPVGVHCILELYNCPTELLNDIAFIKEALQQAAKTARSTLLDQIAYQFSPYGVTALALLAESHISIHTWPENGFLAADVFTCGEHAKPVEACEFLVQAFQAGNHVLMKLPRGGQFSPNPQPKVEIV